MHKCFFWSGWLVYMTSRYTNCVSYMASTTSRHGAYKHFMLKMIHSGVARLHSCSSPEHLNTLQNDSEDRFTFAKEIVYTSNI